MRRVSSQSTRSASRELAQHAQGHVLEVPDRRRADRERHYSSASKPTNAGSDEACFGPEQGGDDANEVAARRKRLRTHRLERGLEEAGRAPG